MFGTLRISLPFQRPARAGTGFAAQLRGLEAVYRQRRALHDLDEAQLRDIGLTRSEAEAEARRPVWDAPARWRS